MERHGAVRDSSRGGCAAHHHDRTKEAPLQQRTIGSRKVSAIGLGGMPMSIEGRPDEDRSIRTIHAALDAGVTLIDTADAYHRDADEVGHNESLIAKALSSWSGSSSDVLVATTGGHLLDEGVIEMAGISNANPDQIREAQEVLGGRLVSVQNQFSPAFRSSRAELDLCAELGIAFLPWSPLGGISKAGDLGSRHDAFAEVATSHDVSPQRVALAWELALAPVVVPIPGASRPESIEDSVQALDLELSADEVARLSAETVD